MKSPFQSLAINIFYFIYLFFYFTIHRVWSSMVIVHGKSYFFGSFFQNISKTAEGTSLYTKALISEHRKNYIFRDNKCFVKMFVSTLVCASEPLPKPLDQTQPNIVYVAVKIRF